MLIVKALTFGSRKGRDASSTDDTDTSDCRGKTIRLANPRRLGERRLGGVNVSTMHYGWVLLYGLL